MSGGMDRLRVQVEPLPTWPHSQARLFVNGHDLADLVREVELPFRLREGHRILANAYACLPAEDALAPSRHLLGEPARGYYRGKVTLLVCTCREAGCFPLMAAVTVTHETVTWSDFVNPFRQPSERFPSRPLWDYAGLGPFVFDRAQYEAELSQSLPEPTPDGVRARRQ